MSCFSYTKLRQNLKKHREEISRSRAPMLITRQHGKPVAMLSLEEYKSMEETLHLLRNPANAERLLQSIAAADVGKLIQHDLDE